LFRINKDLSRNVKAQVWNPEKSYHDFQISSHILIGGCYSYLFLHFHFLSDSGYLLTLHWTIIIARVPCQYICCRCAWI
jgi:hypothetical protein